MTYTPINEGKLGARFIKFDQIRYVQIMFLHPKTPPQPNVQTSNFSHIYVIKLSVLVSNFLSKIVNVDFRPKATQSNRRILSPRKFPISRIFFWNIRRFCIPTTWSWSTRNTLSLKCTEEWKDTSRVTDLRLDTMTEKKESHFCLSRRSYNAIILCLMKTIFFCS